MHQEQLQRMKVAVIGLGYVGLPLAMLCVEKNIHVTGIDIDSRKLDNLQQGKSYLTDISDQEIKALVKNKRFTWTNNFDVLAHVDAIILCVPTPLRDHLYPDLSYLQTAAASISPHLQNGQLVVLESSTFPGTTEEVLLPLLAQSGAKVGKDFYLGYSPERIDPGNNEYKLEDIPKVICGYTEKCKEKVKQLYSCLFNQLIPVSSPKVAELTKLLENSQRFINISFMNEMSIICHEMEIDLWEAIEAAKTKPYGFTAYYPGPGVGGHCIPVDPLYLQWKAKQYDLDTQYINISKIINDSMPLYVVKRITQLLKNDQQQSDNKILLIGLTYKKDVNDIRESTAVMIMEHLLESDFQVSYHDPLVPSITLDGKAFFSVELYPELLRSYDCVVILTDHSKLSYDSITEHARLIFDTRNKINHNLPHVVRL